MVSQSRRGPFWPRLFYCAAASALFGLVFSKSLFLNAQPQSAAPASDQVTFGIIVVSSEDMARKVIDLLRQGLYGLSEGHVNRYDCRSGGVMGPIPRARLRPELRDALAKLHPGEISPVLRVPLGFAVVKRLEQGADVSKDPSLTQAADATGSVKYAFGVTEKAKQTSFCSEWRDGPIGIPTRVWFAICTRNPCQTRSIGLRKCWAKKVPDVSSGDMDVMNAHVTLAQIYGYQGDMDASAREFEQAYVMATKSVPDFILQEALGSAYLHKSEMQNGEYKNPGEMPFTHAAAQQVREY